MGHTQTLRGWVAIILVLLLTACDDSSTLTPTAAQKATSISRAPTPTSAGTIQAPGSTSALPEPPKPVPPTQSSEDAVLPTVAATQTPRAQKLLFVEHFDSNARNWRTGQESDEYSTCDFRVGDGHYRMTVQPTSKYGTCFATVPGVTARDAALSVKVTVARSTAGPGEAKVGFSLRDKDRARYTFYFYNDSSIDAAVWKSGEYTVTHKKAKSTYVHLDPGVTNVFSVTARVQQFLVYVNGHVLYSFANSLVPEAGDVSWLIGADQVGQIFTVDFDDVVVQEP